MQSILVVLMNVLFGLIIFFEYRIRSLALIFWVSIFTVFSIPHSLDILLTRSVYSNIVMNTASVFVIVFNLLYFIVRFIFSYHKKLEWKISAISDEISDRFTKYLFISMIISVILWIIGLYQVTGSILSVSWSHTLQVSGKFSIIASYLFMSSCGLFVLLRVKKKSIIFQILFILLALVIVFLTRARINLIPIFFPIIIYEIYYKKNLKSRLKVVLLGLAFILMVAFVLEFRFLGSLENARGFDMKNIFSSAIDQVLSGQGEFSLRRGMYEFIENENKYNNFNQGITYIRLLLLPFPNSIIKIKPRDFAYDMWDALFPHRQGIGGTYHPTFFGDLFGNFSYYGVIFGIFWSIAFLFLDKLTTRLSNELKLIFIAPLSIMYLLLARGSVYNAIGNAFWAFIILKTIYFISRIKIKV